MVYALLCSAYLIKVFIIIPFQITERNTFFYAYSDPHIDEDILKEALKIVSVDKNEENENEMLRNQISQMDESIGQRMNSMEKMLAELQNNIKRM